MGCRTYTVKVRAEMTLWLKTGLSFHLEEKV